MYEIILADEKNVQLYSQILENDLVGTGDFSVLRTWTIGDYTTHK